MNLETELAFDDQQIESTIESTCKDYGFESALLTVFAGKDGIVPVLYLSDYQRDPQQLEDFLTDMTAVIQGDVLNWKIQLAEIEPSNGEATIYFNPSKDAGSHFTVKNLDDLNYAVKPLRERELERKGAA